MLSIDRWYIVYGHGEGIRLLLRSFNIAKVSLALSPSSPD
jgi:hypothetical protein